MRTTTLVALLGAAVLHSQPAPTPPIKNFAEGWLAVVSCEHHEFGGWTLTLKNVSESPIGYITVFTRDGGGVGADFLGATILPNPQGSYHIQPSEGLAPGATHTMNLATATPERVWILSAVSSDGHIAGAWVESAATLAGWLGESIQDEHIYELTKIVASDDSDRTIDAVIEQIKALGDRPALTIDRRIQSLVSDPSLGRRSGAVQFAFYAAMSNAKGIRRSQTDRPERHGTKLFSVSLTARSHGVASQIRAGRAATFPRQD